MQRLLAKMYALYSRELKRASFAALPSRLQIMGDTLARSFCIHIIIFSSLFCDYSRIVSGQQCKTSISKFLALRCGFGLGRRDESKDGAAKSPSYRHCLPTLPTISAMREVLSHIERSLTFRRNPTYLSHRSGNIEIRIHTLHPGPRNYQLGKVEMTMRSYEAIEWCF